MTRFRILIILSTLTFIILIQSCKNINKTEDSNPHLETEQIVNIDSQNTWPNNDKPKIFKIDSSSFEIYATKSYWGIRLDSKDSFENQLNKIKQTLKLISKESDLKELRKIIIQPPNDELLADIAKVPEIQKELKSSALENRIVKSMSIISINAYKSTKLEAVTDLFRKWNLEPYAFYIDKCHEKKIEKDSIFYTMYCATISFKLRDREFLNM